jgi:Cu(I)/Ag(I) efflux system protein CusF
MKRIVLCTLAVAATLAAPAAFAQQKMDDMMKGKDMNGMMKGMDMGAKPSSAGTTHKAAATVKKADPKAGTVTLAHEPVKSLNWPSMTMGFKVADPKLFDKLTEGKQVEVEFQQSGKDYVVTAVK